VRENALSTDRALLSRDDLRSFVENVVLTSSRLIEVMDRHGLFRAAAARSRVLALAEMRESIGVEILQDYFAEDRLEHGPKRTARIVITFKSNEPEEAHGGGAGAWPAGDPGRAGPPRGKGPAGRRTLPGLRPPRLASRPCEPRPSWR